MLLRSDTVGPAEGVAGTTIEPMYSTFPRLLLAISLALAGTAHAAPASDGNDHGYDPAANPFAALKAAEAEAGTSGRRVLLEAGGAWCRWCREFDRFLALNPDLDAQLAHKFVKVKVYVGEDDMNEVFFSLLPPFKGLPTFWLIDPDGTVRWTDVADAFQDGHDHYDRTVIQRFLDTH